MWHLCSTWLALALAVLPILSHAVAVIGNDMVGDTKGCAADHTRAASRSGG